MPNACPRNRIPNLINFDYQLKNSTWLVAIVLVSTDIGNFSWKYFVGVFINKIYVCMYLKEREGEREAWGEREVSFNHWFTQMAITSKTVPSRSKEPRTPPESPTWVAQAQVLEPSSAAFPGKLIGSWIGTRDLGFELAFWYWRPV